MASTNTKEGMVSVPRVALQALAEYAYSLFASSRIWAKLPPTHPRWVSWGINDDLHMELERERMAFLKDIFWKAYNEAWKREIGCHKVGLEREDPTLEMFMECLAEMEDRHWDEPLTAKVVTKRKRAIRARKAEQTRLKYELESPNEERTLNAATFSGDISLKLIEESLGSEESEIRTKAAKEVQRLMAELGKLKLTALD